MREGVQLNGRDEYRTCIIATGSTKVEKLRSERILKKGLLPVVQDKGHSFLYFSKKGFIRTTTNIAKAQRFHPIHAITIRRMLNLISEDAEVPMEWVVWSVGIPPK